jgi:hypothetical protein
MLAAAHLGEASTAQYLLDEHCIQYGADLELPASLQLSARCGNETMARLLLGAGANINSLGHSGDDFVDTSSTWNNGVCSRSCMCRRTHPYSRNSSKSPLQSSNVRLTLRGCNGSRSTPQNQASDQHKHSPTLDD